MTRVRHGTARDRDRRQTIAVGGWGYGEATEGEGQGDLVETVGRMSAMAVRRRRSLRRVRLGRRHGLGGHQRCCRYLRRRLSFGKPPVGMRNLSRK